MQSLKTVSAVHGALLLAGVGAFAALAPQLHATASKPATGATAVLYAPAAAAPLETQGAAAAVAAVAPDEALRARIHWVPVRQGGKKLMTLDDASRLMLVQAAAKRAGLADVGLGYQDVYGVINAETSWIPRTGMGKTGTPSYGLAQFEPGTAKGLGLKDPNDPVQAVYAAAVNMRHAADWAADRIDALKLSPKQYAAKLREGVSVYYNLSTKGRRKWNGLNTAKLPIETQRHIKNVRIGAEQAVALAQEIAAG